MTSNETCHQIQDDLVAHLDGELDVVSAGRVGAHLETCAACAAQRDALARAWKSLDLLGVPSAVDAGWVEGLAGRILAEADASTTPAAVRLLPGGASGKAGEVADVRPGQVARPAPASASRRLAVAAAVLLAAGLTWFALRGPAPKGDLALQPEHPAPTGTTPQPVPTVELPGKTPPPVTPRSEPSTPDRPVQVKQPDKPEDSQAPRRPPASGDRDPYDGLSPEDMDIVSNLDVVEAIAEVEDLQTIHALPVLDDLDPEELDEG